MKFLLATVCFVVALFSVACGAASRQPNTDAPRPAQPAYPFVIVGSDDRRQQTLQAWQELLNEQGTRSTLAPELQPATATVRSFPASSAASISLQLPRIGSGEQIESPEATHEALRRFLDRASLPLLGVEPEALSLLEVKPQSDGTQRARYAQRSFPYPLRGGYGIVEITFDSARKVQNIFSTTIPDAEQLRRRLSSLRPLLTADEVRAKIIGQSLAFIDATGTNQTSIATAPETITVRELVLYPVIPIGAADSLELHLAWECLVQSSIPVIAYVDAVTGAVVAVTSANATGT